MNLIVMRNKKLFTLNMYYNGIEIGKSVSASINKNKSMIYNINIKSKYQGLGYGNYLLNSTENLLLLENNNLRNISIVVYQKDDNLINFYKKNNYDIIKDSNNIYDDGEYIYNLYQMIKFIK